MRSASIVATALAAAVVVPHVPAATAQPIADDDYYARAPDRDPEKKVRLHGQIGMLLGYEGIGPIGGLAGGVQIAAGPSFGRFIIHGEYDFLSVGDSYNYYTDTDPVRGLVHRFGGNVRYRFARVGGKDSILGGDFWAEVGLGRQYLQWYGGGKLTRNDVSFGLGSELTLKFGEPRRKRIGIAYALKVLGMARPDEKYMPPTCAGPCDEPTGPIPYDLGIMFNFAVMFGS
jgi:hypothetical protein